MTIRMRYWVTLTCDACGKTLEFESLQLGADNVPLDWVQAVPPGERMQREFCSAACIGNYKPPAKPWQEEVSA